jgi:hypothetical protein
VNHGPDDERPQPGGDQVPDEFDAIVAGWVSEGSVPAWPSDTAPVVAEPDPEPEPATAAAPEPVALPEPPPPAPAPLFTPAEDEHFVPPEPPPLPKLGPPAIVGLVLLALGLILVLVPGWLGVGPAYGLPLGLLTLASGLGWLVLRLWPDPPEPPSGPDDGAIV